MTRAPAPTPSAFEGVLETPLAGAPGVIGERLPVRGWALQDGRAIVGVEARCGAAAAVALRIGLQRPDVAAAYADAHDGPAAAFPGFAGDVPLAGLAPGLHSLEVVVRTADAQAHRWTRTVEIADPAHAYARWRERLLAAARARWPASDDPRAVPFATWIVVTHADTAAADLARTFASLRRAGPGFDVVVGAAGEALPLPPTPYVGELQAGDVLAPGAAALLGAVLRAHPGIDLLYSDHHHLGEPVLKPAWDSLLATHPDVAARPWLLHRGRHRGEAWTAGAPLDAQAIGCARVAHLPLPLVSVKAARDAPTSIAPPAAPPAGTVSVIVPTCLADVTMLTRCLDGLRRHTHGAERIDLVVVLNNLPAGMTEAEARALLAPWAPTMVWHAGAFNWSALSNRGVQASTGEWLLFLNDDVEPAGAGWLDAMLALAQRPGVGVVGAVLRYPEGDLQHAGVTVAGRDAPTCRHVFRGCSGDERRVARWLVHDRVQSAVTGACLLTPRTLFLAHGGFEAQLPVAFNDIDYCVRLRQSGHVSVVCAAARLVHHEGRSRAGIAEGADEVLFRQRWAGRLPEVDPHGHPALARDRDDWLPDPGILPQFMTRISMHKAPGPTLHETDLHWQRWGDEDPYFGVITQDIFHRDKLDDQALRLFFESGQAHARHVLTMCRQYLDPAFAPQRVLDFGCGVGRLLVAFAERASEVVGVDISEGMLAESRRNCDARGLGNVVLALSDDELSRVEGQFDLVHSIIVLQHLEPQRGREIFARLVERIRPGGLGALHLTYAKAYLPDSWGQPQPAVVAEPELPPAPAPAPVAQAAPADAERKRWQLPFLRRTAEAVVPPPAPPAVVAPAPAPVAVEPDPAASPEIQMNVYPLNEMFFLVQSQGIRQMHVEFTDHGGELGVVLYFKRPVG